jgi:hypothetical protein
MVQEGPAPREQVWPPVIEPVLLLFSTHREVLEFEP